MLKLKLQFFGHLMQKADSLEKTLILVKIESRRKRVTEDEMVGWHHQLNGREFEQTPGASEGQGSLVCCSLWNNKKSCLTLCNPMNCIPPASSIHLISQARILEWFAFPSPGDLPNTGIEPAPPELARRFWMPPGKPNNLLQNYQNFSLKEHNIWSQEKNQVSLPKINRFSFYF